MNYVLANMMSASSAAPSQRDIRRLQRAAARCNVVVLLGRRVQAALSTTLRQAVGLPHPASRRRDDLETLRRGIFNLVEVVTSD